MSSLFIKSLKNTRPKFGLGNPHWYWLPAWCNLIYSHSLRQASQTVVRLSGQPRAGCQQTRTRWLLNTSKDEDSTASLGLFPLLGFSHSKKSVPWCSVCTHCLLFCYWAPLKRAWFHLLCTLLSDVCNDWWDSATSSLFFSRLNIPTSLLFLIDEMLPSLYGLSAGLSPVIAFSFSFWGVQKGTLQQP